MAKIAFIYIGTVIGAGFASGREIIEFFAIYGVKGFLGMTISGILFAFLGAFLLSKIYNKKIKGFDELINSLFGEKFGFIIDTIITFSLYTGYSIMVAGSGAVFREELGLSFNMGVLTMVFFSFIIFLFSLEGLSIINSILVPLLIIGIVFTSFYLNIREGFNFINMEGINITDKGNFITSSFLYFGSNSLLILVVFSALLPVINDKKTAILGGIIGGSILFILGISILALMLMYYNEVFSLDIPMLKVCDYIGENYRKVYAIILWIAMFTTALANGFGFMNRISRKRNNLWITALFSISAIPIANIGFSNLVGTLYPFFGFIGFLVMAFTLIKG